jgi:hypothetical protein
MAVGVALPAAVLGNHARWQSGRAEQVHDVGIEADFVWLLLVSAVVGASIGRRSVSNCSFLYITRCRFHRIEAATTPT